jgi:hypothetical protein
MRPHTLYWSLFLCKKRREVTGIMANQKIKDQVTAKGFFRLKITEFDENGRAKVIGDSKWKQNLITNLGYQNFIVGSLGAIAASSQASYFALGLGTAPGATDTALQSELTDAAGCRFTVSPSAVSSKTLQLTGSLASNVITANRTIQNVGIFAVSTTSAGTLFAGNTYATSQLQTNQQVNVTYQIRFS